MSKDLYFQNIHLILLFIFNSYIGLLGLILFLLIKSRKLNKRLMEEEKCIVICENTIKEKENSINYLRRNESKLACRVYKLENENQYLDRIFNKTLNEKVESFERETIRAKKELETYKSAFENREREFEITNKKNIKWREAYYHLSNLNESGIKLLSEKDLLIDQLKSKINIISLTHCIHCNPLDSFSFYSKNNFNNYKNINSKFINSNSIDDNNNN
ncbi:hypothetical protein ACTFIV_002497 [Dictyostelium citrinum]